MNLLILETPDQWGYCMVCVFIDVVVYGNA